MPIFIANARANFANACGRSDFSTALKNIRLIERGARHLQPNEVARHFRDFTKLCLDHGNKGRYAFQFAVKAYRRAALPEIRVEAVEMLLALADSCAQHKEIAEELGPQFDHLIGSSLKQTIHTMTSEEAEEWFRVVDTLDRNTYHVEQKLLIEVFLPTMAAGQPRAEIASRHLETSMWAERFYNVEADHEKIAASAKIFVEEGQAVIEAYSSEAFFMMIATLNYFDQLDYADQAMVIRQPETTDPVQYLVELARGRRDDLEAAFQSLKGSSSRYETLSQQIIREISAVQIKIAGEYLDQRLKDQPAMSQTPSWRARLLYQPLNSDQALSEKLFDYLRALLKLHAEPVRKLAPFWVYLELLIKEKLTAAYIVYFPSRHEFVVYFDDKGDNRWIKVVFPTDGKGKEEVFVATPGNEAQVGTIMQAAKLLASSEAEISAQVKGKLTTLVEKVSKELVCAARRLFEKENSNLYKTFAIVLADDQRLQDRVVEMHNRLHLARNIFTAYLKQIEEETYELQSDDLLAQLIKSIAFYPFEKLAQMKNQGQLGGLLPQKDGKYPFVVGLKPEANEAKEILLVVHSPQKIVVPGHGQLSGVEAEFVYDLIYEAAVKLSIKTAAESLQQTGYLFKRDIEAAKGLAKLKRINAHYFKTEMAKRGLLAFDWFTYEPIGDDGLYHPIPDQGEEVKRALFAEGNLDEIYAKTEIEGLAMLLPVRKKKVEGKIILAPWERQLLREEQQRILGDTRVLPVYYGLYILTYFSDGKAHAFRYLIKATEAEILKDDLIADVEKRLADGFFHDPEIFLKGTSRQDRALLEAELASEQLTILEQEVQVYRLNTTFKRPTMERLSDLLEQGYTLEPQG